MQDRDHLIHNIFQLITSTNFNLHNYMSEGNIETSRFNYSFQQITFDKQEINTYLNGSLYKYKKLDHLSAHGFLSLICYDFIKFTSGKSVKNFRYMSQNDCEYILSEIKLFKDSNEQRITNTYYVDNFILLFEFYINKKFKDRQLITLNDSFNNNFEKLSYKLEKAEEKNKNAWIVGIIVGIIYPIVVNIVSPMIIKIFK